MLVEDNSDWVQGASDSLNMLPEIGFWRSGDSDESRRGRRKVAITATKKRRKLKDAIKKWIKGEQQLERERKETSSRKEKERSKSRGKGKICVTPQKFELFYLSSVNESVSAPMVMCSVCLHEIWALSCNISVLRFFFLKLRVWDYDIN